MFSITKPRVPEGLRDLMKDLTREILKEKPTDIYTFAEYYFLSRLPEKEHYKVKKFEDNSGKYDFSYIQNSQRYQIPVALVYSIIPENLTNLIKDLIKAILREQPENLCDFAVEYFRHLKATMKSVNPTENIAKEINYSAYENYFNNKERFLLTSYVKCKCGRILGESEDNNYNVIQNDDKKDKNKGRRISEKDFTFREKYLNSVILIQQYFRRYLKARNAKTNTNETLKGSAITEQLNQTSNQSKVIIPQLHLNQVETENVPEDASYASASTALLSASESGRDNSDLSITESIPTKTIIEREEIENNEKNFPTSHQSRSNEAADDDCKSTLNDKKLNTGEGDTHKLTGVQSNKARNFDIIREKFTEDKKEEPSETEHCPSNKDNNGNAGNSSLTDGSGSSFEDHKEINSELFEANPIVDTKIHSNEGENNQNEIINASLQTKEKRLESIQKDSNTENMNADSENIRKTSDRQQENSSIETNVVLSESESAEIQHESNKPQTHANNSNKNFEIELENKVFANENVNDNGSLEKNLENLPSNISRDYITSSDVSTEEQKLLKSNKYSKEKNAECINNDLSDVQVEALSTEEDVNLMIKNSTLNTDGPKNKNDHVYEHKHGDGNPNNLKSDRESVQHVLTLPVNVENIQTTDVTTDKIPCDESENIVDFNSNHKKSEHMDTNNESEILCENQNNLFTLHESNNSFHEQDSTLTIINDEENKTNNDNSREQNANVLNKVKSNDNSNDREIEINTISKAHQSEISFPNVNNNDNILTSSIADITPENHQTGSIVKDLNTSEIFFLENRDIEKKGTTTEKKNSENIRSDVSDNSEAGQKFKLNAVDSKENDTISDNIIANNQISMTSQTRPSEEEKPEQSTDQNIDMEERKLNEQESQSDENKSSQKEKEGTTTEAKNSENIRSDVSDNSEAGQKFKLNVVDSKENDTISDNIIANNQISMTSQTRPSEEEKPEQSTDQNIDMKERKSNEKESKSDENKSFQNQDIEKEGTTTKKMNSENIRSDVSDNSETGQKFKLNAVDSKENDTISGNTIADDQYSMISPTRPSKKEKPEQSTDQNIDMEERQSNEKKSQSDENKSSQKEKEGTTTEAKNSENIRSDVSDNSEAGQKFKLNVVDSKENDTISDNIIANNQISMASQTRPSEEEKPEQSTDQNIDMKERKSNEKESKSDENKSFQNQDIEKEGTTTKKMNSENIRSDVSDNSETGQKFKLNVVDSKENDTISDNTIADDQYSMISPTRPSKKEKPEQSTDQNIDMEERKLNEQESQSDENKSSQNLDMEKEDTTTKKMNSENIRSDVSDNSETGQKFKLNVVDSKENDTISDNTIADDQYSMISPTRPSKKEKPEQSTDQNIDMEERKLNEQESQSDENKSSQKEKEGTTTEAKNSENIRSDVSDNSEAGQKFKLNVVDYKENDTISDNIIANNQISMTSQTIKENKPGQSIDKNIDMEERKSNQKESQSDENKSSQIQDIGKEGTTTENMNSENIRSDIIGNPETEQNFELSGADSIRNVTISGNIIVNDQSNMTLHSTDQNFDMEERQSNEKKSQSDENKSSQKEKEGTTTETKNSENVRSDVSDNSEAGQKFKLNAVDSKENDTISGNTIADDQYSMISPTRPSKKEKPEQSTDQNIRMEERKLNEQESQSDENKSSRNLDMEKEDTRTEKMNSENTRSDVSDNSETGQKFKLDVVDSVGYDKICDNIYPDDQSNTTLETNPSKLNKPEQIIVQNIDLKEAEKMKVNQNKPNDLENENIHFENTITFTTDDLNTETKSDEINKFQYKNADESVEQDVLNMKILGKNMDDNQISTILENNIKEDIKNKGRLDPNQENLDDNSEFYTLKSTIKNNVVGNEQASSYPETNEKEIHSDANKSDENRDMEQKCTRTKKINSENTRSDVNDNLNTGQKFELNVVDSVGNDTISDNISAGDQCSTISQTRPSEENKSEQSIDQNSEIEERKSNEDVSKSDENKSSQNYGMEKDGSTIEKKNSENIRSDVRDNSETGQKFELSVVDSVGNDTISDNIIADDHSSMTSQTNPSEVNKSEQSVDQNIDMEKANKKQNDSNDVENENIRFENTTTDTINNLKIKIKSDENCENTNDTRSPENYILNKTILDKILADEQISPIAPNNDTVCCDISQQNERNLNNNIDMNEEKVTGIHRNDSKESEIKKTTSKDTRREFADNVKIENSCRDNLLEENCDKNIHINETFTPVINDEKIHFDDFGSEATDKLNLKVVSDITNDENTAEKGKKSKNEVGKSTEQQEKIDQSIEVKRERRETIPIDGADSNESINEKTNSENECIDPTDNPKAEICCDGLKELHDENDIKCIENDNLNEILSDTVIADNQVNTTIQESNTEDPNEENLVQRIDIENEKKTQMTQNGTKIAINEGINFEDTIIKETENSNTEVNSDENLKHHDKNTSESFENYILNKTIFGKPLPGNKQKLEQNEENLDRNKLETGTSTDSTREIHHENVSISDNITEGEQKCDVNSAQIKCNETSDDTGKNSEKSQELIEHNNLNKSIENSNVKQGSLTTEENESFEIKHRSGGTISDQTVDKEKESKNEISCDNARFENANVKSETRFDGIDGKSHTEKLNTKANTEEPMANETDDIVHSAVKFRDEEKVNEAEITNNHGSLESSKPTENSNITDRDLITDLREQPPFILTNTESETENEFDKKKNISDETNIELRQLGLITSSDGVSKDGVMASASNKTDEGSSTSSCNSINKYIESDDSKANDSCVSTKDNGVGKLDKENTPVQSKVNQEDMPASITSNKIENECKINDDGSIRKIASEANENTATTQQKQELSPTESLNNIPNHNGGNNPNSTNVTKTMENLKTSEDDLAAKDLSAARHVDDFKLNDLNTIDQLELPKDVKQQISTEKLNEINHLEIETNNCSKTNIENNFSHKESVNSQDNKLKHTEINNYEGKSNEDLNMMTSHKSSHLNVTDNESYEDITKIERYIREKRLVSDVENDIEIKNERQQEIISHQENHEAPSNTLPNDADGKGEDTSDQATTLSIGNKTPVKSVIGIQNFNIDRIRFYNEGLLGSISGQRFAETHLRSFWKEYLMNNSKPLGQYDTETNGIYSNQLLDSEKYEPQESKSTTYIDKNHENTNVEATIVKETTKDSESIPANKQNLPSTHVINKDVERIPRYFYGALEELEDNKTVASKPKTYKEPLAFIIPIGDINKAPTSKTDAVKKLTPTNSNNETHLEVIQKDLSNNFTNLDLTFCAKTEPLLEAETPPQPLEDLNQFEQRLHDIDLDITYTINEILNLKYEDDLQNNSDENGNLNDSISDYSLTPEPMLQTIVELSESETPRPLRQLQSNNDNNIDLTAESNEDNSLISDELLGDENENTTNDHTHTQTGGIYEYSTNEFDNVARLNDTTLHENSHVTPNTDTFEEVSKESLAYHDSNANRILMIDSSNKKDEKIESKNGIGNIEACLANISKEEGKTIDYRNKNETDFDETLLDNKQIVSIIATPLNNDSLHEGLKGIAAKKIQRFYRQHLQNTANRLNKDNLETDDKIKGHDVELVSTIVDSLNTKCNDTESPVEEIEIENVKKPDNIDNSDTTFKDERCSKEGIKKFNEFSENSTSLGEQESESVSTSAYSEMKNFNKSTENCNECSSAVTNNLENGYNSNSENNNKQSLCKAKQHHEQHNFNDVSPKRETSSFAGNLQCELDIGANDRLSQKPTPNDDLLHENLKGIAAKKIQRVYRQHLHRTANRDNKGDLETNDIELVSTTVDSFHTKFSEIDSPEGVIKIKNVKKGDNIDERNSKEQDKKFGEFSKNSNISDEQESELVNSNSEMKNMNDSIEGRSECYSTVMNNLKMDRNSDNDNNNNQLNSNEAEKYHEQHNIIENHPSITGNLQSELNVTANDRSNQKPSTSEAANDNDIQVTGPAMNIDKAAKIIQAFFKKYIKSKHKSNTNSDLQKTHWFVGDEPIVTNEESPSLPKTKSEISFYETEAYVVLTTNVSQYLVDSNSSEAIDTNSFSRTPTAPITNQSSDSCCCSSSSDDSLVEKCINLPKGSVLTDVSQPAAATAPYVGIQSSGASGDEVNEKKARYTNLVDQFITSERFYSGIVNRNYSYSDVKDIQFPSSNITEITKILTEFLDSQSENLKSDIRYEILEEPCIKKTVEEEISNSVSSSSSDIDDAEDSLDTKTVKLEKPEIAITKMQKRRNSTSKISSLDKLKEYNFNEPKVVSIENLDTDEEGIVVARLQRDETRESTGQSDVDVVIGSTVKDDDSNLKENFNFDSTFPSKGSLKRVHTIGDEVEAKFLLKNVTIDESIKYIEPPDHELNDSSLCLDDETTANIRHKMMAYSLSEADSDVFERTADDHDSSSWALRNKKYDDFNISTALIGNGDTSTETESTTVSAVTKIQVGTGGSSNSSKVSIGNAAISESLEHLVKEAAAKRIQKMYRQHYRLKTTNANNKIKSSLECTKSMETTLAHKRSIMLQRGDALRNGSSPEEATSSSNSGEIENNSCIKSKTLPEQESKAIFTDNTTSSCSLPSSAKSAAAIRAKKIEDNKRRWTAMRQNSMPVQIDSEVLRVIPKYIRKKIKSAEGEKRKDRRRMLLMD